MPKILAMYSNAPPTERHLRALKAIRDDVKIVVAQREDEAIQNANEAEIILGHRYLHQTLPHAHSLKWIQSTAAGTQHLLCQDLLRLNPLLTRCSIFSENVAQHALALMFAIIRRLPQQVMAQQQGRWADPNLWAKPQDFLAFPRTAMILGMGNIGTAIANLLKGLGLHIIGMDRGASEQKRLCCDELSDQTQWFAHLKRVDVLFLSLPLTDKTGNLVNTRVLEALPDHAVIINTARGALIDTSALIDRLRRGKLGGAAIDVLDPIPTSEHDPLWTTPNLLITPKVAVFQPEHQYKLELFIEQQLSRYLQGQTLLDQVDIATLQT